MYKCKWCNSGSLVLVYSKNIDREYYERSYNITDSDYGKHLDIYKCSNCNLTQVYEPNIGGLLSKYYSSMNDPDYNEESTGRQKSFIKILKTLKKIKPAGKLIDIGCSTGLFLNIAKDEGYEVTGIDPSPWAIKTMKKNFNIDGQVSSIEELELIDEYFDLITIHDVIEHLEDPKHVLSKLTDSLKKGGVLCVTTPRIDSLVPKLLRDRWWHVRPAHLFYFSKHTLVDGLKELGYKKVLTEDYIWHFSIYYLITRLLGLFGINKTLSGETSIEGFLKKLVVPVNFKDSITVYAVK